MSKRSLPMAKRRTKEQLERHALNLLERCCPHCLVEPEPVPVKDILQYDLEESYGIGFYVTSLPFDLEAVTRPAQGHLPIRIEMQPHVFDLLDRDNGRARFTAAHEIGHALLHIEEIDVDLVDGEVSGLYRESSIPWAQTLNARPTSTRAGYLCRRR